MALGRLLVVYRKGYLIPYFHVSLRDEINWSWLTTVEVIVLYLHAELTEILNRACAAFSLTPAASYQRPQPTYS